MRRHPIVGDLVVLDYNELNAITVCTDINHDPDDSSNDKYRLDYIAGLSLHDGEIQNMSGCIWLLDDQANMSIVGVNGCRLPLDFYGLDTKKLLEDAGYKFDE